MGRIMSARTLLEDYHRTVWTEGDLDAVDRFFAPEAHAEGLMPEASFKPKDLRVLAQAVRGLIRRPRFTVLRMVEEGEWASALVVMEGTVAASGRRVRCEGQIMFRHADGRMIEGHNSFDMLGVFIQAGALAPDALPRILAGETLG